MKKMIGKPVPIVDGNGGVSRGFLLFFPRSMFFFLSLFCAVPCLKLGSQHSTARHSAFSFSWAMLHFYFEPFPCARLRTKQGKETRLRDYSPVARPSEDSLQHALALYLSI
jgi:hypothetical protein